MDIAAALLLLRLRATDVHRPRIVESVTVTAIPGSLQTLAGVTTLWRDSLVASPAATLDDALRFVFGFSLFRRSSLLNPGGTSICRLLLAMPQAASART